MKVYKDGREATADAHQIEIMIDAGWSKTKPEPKVEPKKPEPKVEPKKPEIKIEPKKPEPEVEIKPIEVKETTSDSGYSKKKKIVRTIKKK